MKIYTYTLIAIASIISCTSNQKTKNLENPKKQTTRFPEDFIGVYKGQLKIITNNGEQEIPMELHLEDAADSTRYGYKIFYGKERSERAYNLVRTHNENLFLIDENNGIILESGFSNNTLFSTYEVMGNLLNNTEKFFEDRMEFSITMSRVTDTSLTGNAESAIVKNYPISVMQTATLYKQKKKPVAFNK